MGTVSSRPREQGMVAIRRRHRPRLPGVGHGALAACCSAAMAIFRSFDPWGLKMWTGTGCGGFSQDPAAMAGPVHDSRGSTATLAEAVGARPIIDTAAAAVSTVAKWRRMSG
jgi:hypothetical protein